MSWVAEANATSRARPISQGRWLCGLHRAMPSSPRAISTCENTSQERRRPRRPTKGRRHWSSIGDQTHLKAYTSPSQLAKPMVSRATPASRSHTDRVLNTSMVGRPAAKPSSRRARQ